MSKSFHFIFISLMVILVSVTLAYLIYLGSSYYNVSIEERFFHDDHETLKPSGAIGHGLGIIGSLLMIIGVGLYMIRKRSKMFSRLGLLKHWLEFHIFLCTLGPIMVLFHTSFKFGGVVSISFWSMVAVFLSGIIGRFIYIQIPRTIEGREMSLNDIRNLRSEINESIKDASKFDMKDHEIVSEILSQKDISKRKKINQIKKLIRTNNVSRKNQKKLIQLVRNDINLNRRIDRLTTMQNLFKYWHVAHLPFALVMLIIMIIHVAVTIIFGYRWIF